MSLFHKHFAASIVFRSIMMDAVLPIQIFVHVCVGILIMMFKVQLLIITETHVIMNGWMLGNGIIDCVDINELCISWNVLHSSKIQNMLLHTLTPEFLQCTANVTWLTNAHYKNKTNKYIRIYHIIIVLNCLHVLVTLCGHLHGGFFFFWRIYYKDNQTNVKL